MSRLARRYKISDVGLAKVCRELNVPIPPRGSWARVQSGQKPIKPELPKLTRGTPETATISPISRLRDLPEVVRLQRSFEADPAHRIVVNSDQKLHPLAQATKTALSAHHRSGSSTVPLNIRLSESIRDRALLLMSAMIYALEERGFSAEAASEKCGSALSSKVNDWNSPWGSGRQESTYSRRRRIKRQNRIIGLIQLGSSPFRFRSM
jgi:hypothetical protein